MDDGLQRNNQSEHGRGGRKTAVVMLMMVGLVNVRVQGWMLWARSLGQKEEGGNREGDGTTLMGDESKTNNDETMMGTNNNQQYQWEGGDDVYCGGGSGGQLEV